MLYKIGELNQAILYLEQLGFEKQDSNDPFPETRTRKDIGIVFKGENFQVHAHVIEKNSDTYKKQMSFKTHMLNNENDRLDYEKAKLAMISQGFTDQDAYGKANPPFVKSKIKVIHS